MNTNPHHKDSRPPPAADHGRIIRTVPVIPGRIIRTVPVIPEIPANNHKIFLTEASSD